MSLPTGPLSGFRVLDACDELGVYATKLLVNLGADVVRLEPPGGDAMRSFPPLVNGISQYFEHFNAGKRSVTLDLSTAAGITRLGRLVATCSAVVESGQPDALLSTRVGLARLLEFRAGLVLVSVTPFGLNGPGRDHSGSDLIVAAESGLLALNGRPDAAPYRPGGEQAAHMAGLVAANAALLGIFDQQRTGRGCRVEVPANFAATLSTTQTGNANAFTWHGRVPRRRGMGMPAFRSLFQTCDGWVVLIALPGQWNNLVRLMTAHGAESDLAGPEYQDAQFRVTNAEHINALIGAFAGRYTKQNLSDKAQKAGVACTPVNDPADIIADPFLQERGYFRAVQHPSLPHTASYSGPPFHFAQRDVGTWEPAHAVGADNTAIWEHELGLESEEQAMHASAGEL